jgi:hypothetical protein
MRNFLMGLFLTLVVASAGLFVARAQTTAPSSAKSRTQSKIPDFSGYWGYSDSHPSGQTFSISDPNGRKAGTPEDDTPYKPATLAKLRAERPESGPNATFENTTDPRLKYCDPVGFPRIYLVPTRFRFEQHPNVVYMMYEYGPFWRPIAMNRAHLEDPGPSWWGDSIGRYEGDTLVIDTIGFNDKTWIDHVGRSHSDALHLVERFRRIDHDTLELDLTFDDPKAYERPWNGTKIFALTQSESWDPYSCSMSEYEHFRDTVINRAAPSGK